MKHLLALLCALALICGAGAMWYVSQPTMNDVQTMLEERPFQLHMSSEQFQSIDFVTGSLHNRIEAGDNPRLLFGSSELTPIDGISSHPSRLFGGHNYGFDTMTIGRPFFQDLWHAVEIGALDNDIPDGKAVIFAGIQWFMTYQGVAEDYRYAFSPSSFERFMSNSALSAETKEAVRRKSVEYGIDERLLSGSPTMFPPDVIDNAISDLATDRKVIDTLLEESNSSGSGACEPIPAERFGEPEDPDWDEWLAAETEEAMRQTSSNSEGFIDSYYESSYDGWLESAKANYSFEEGSEYLETEWEDFELLLQVCKETGIEPLLVIMPVKGAAYDQTVYTREVREIWYERMRTTCEQAGIEYADFSDHDYDKYFMYDVMHLGWTGWVHVNHAIYDFFKDDE